MDTFLSVHKDNEAKQGSSQSRAPIKSHGVTPGAAGFRSQSQGVSACPLSSDIVSGVVNDIHLQCSGGIAQKEIYTYFIYRSTFRDSFVGSTDEFPPVSGPIDGNRA